MAEKKPAKKGGGKGRKITSVDQAIAVGIAIGQQGGKSKKAPSKKKK